MSAKTSLTHESLPTEIYSFLQVFFFLCIAHNKAGIKQTEPASVHMNKFMYGKTYPSKLCGKAGFIRKMSEGVARSH